MTYRSRYDIYADIVRATKPNGRSRSYVVYSAGLSKMYAPKYLSEIERLGYIEFGEGSGLAKQIVRSTPKGDDFLRRHDMENGVYDKS